MNKTKTGFIAAAMLFALFLVFTLLTATVDREACEAGSIGFSSLNKAVSESIGTSRFWHIATEALGIVALIECAGFALIGLLQLIARKNLFKVDGSILALGATYALLAAFYLLFLVVTVNYRPFSPADLSLAEPSYPSSHTMLAVAVFGTGALAFAGMTESRKTALVFTAVSSALAALTVFGRILSGVHWITDVIGGILLGFAHVALYLGLSGLITGKQKENNKKQRISA